MTIDLLHDELARRHLERLIEAAGQTRVLATKADVGGCAGAVRSIGVEAIAEAEAYYRSHLAGSLMPGGDGDE